MIILVCALLIIGGLLFQSCTSKPSTEKLRSYTETKTLVEAKCSQCHSIKIGEEYIAKATTDKPVIELLAGKSRFEWENTVSRMKNIHKCDINENEVDKIVQFLSENYGKDLSVKALPTDGQELTKIACGTCHGIVIIDVNNPQDIIARITKSPLGYDIRLPAGKDDWRDTVTRMIVKNSCAIPQGVDGPVFQKIVNWLNTNFNSNVGQHLDPVAETGQKLTEIYCGICHGLVINGVRVASGPKYWDIKLPVNKDFNGWKATIERMVEKNNCPLPGGINSPAIDKIANYLANLNIPSQDISSLSGMELTQLFCGQCHGLVVANERITHNVFMTDVVLLDGKTGGTRNDWHFTVARMIDVNGCPIPGGVNDCSVDPTTPFCKIVSYLETNYGAGCCGDVSYWDDEKLVRSACGSCHGIRGYSKVISVSPGIDAWLFDGKSAQDWELTIKRMMNINGAVIPGGTNGAIFNRIVSWLTNNVGAGCCGTIPVTEPDLIAQAACGTCHGMVIGSAVNNKRLTRGMTLYYGKFYGWDAMPLGKDIVHWTKTVNRMLIRRLATRGTNPDIEQRQALINWLVQEAGISVYNDPETQGARPARELYMTYCHKCHGPEAEGMIIREGYQWITEQHLAKKTLATNEINYAWGLRHRIDEPGTQNDHPNWPPATDTPFMPNYVTTNPQPGFPDRVLFTSEWDVLDIYLKSYAPQADCTNCHRWHEISSDFLPPEGDSDGDNTIDFPRDTTPPAPPVIQNVTTSTGSITISWSGNTEKDFMGYLLMYSDISNCNSDCSSCSTWTPANVVVSPLDNIPYHMPIYDTQYTINSLASGSYCVMVLAVDLACWSPRPTNFELPCNNSATTTGPINVP